MRTASKTVGVRESSKPGPKISTWRVRRGAVVALGVLAAIALIGACAPQEELPEMPDSSGLHVNLVEDGFEISWFPTGLGQAGGYQLQVLQADPAVGTWSDIPTPANSEGEFENQVLFSDVEEGVRYMFRIRDGGAPDSSFSRLVNAWFVKPKLPIIRVDTENHVPIINKKPYLPATVEVDPNGSGYEAFNGSAQVKGRGNSTWDAPKKPYAIKLDSKSKLMGLPKSKKWVLLANYFDPSQLRTYAAAEISEATDLAWTPGYRWVELIFNGAYQGVYQLAEKIDIGNDKVDIDEMGSEDNEGEALTGGYLLETEGRLEEKGDPGWRTPLDIGIAVNEPDPMTPQQANFIKGHVNAFENALFSPHFTDPLEGYARYLDVESFIDYWITQETTRNADAFWSSTYFYKQRGNPKLIFGPIWDHDMSMGNIGTPWDQSPTGWHTPLNRPWVRQLFRDPAIVEAANDRWGELLQQISEVPGRLLLAGAELEAAKENDSYRWKYAPAPEQTPEFLAQWLQSRIDWMTTALSDWAAGAAPAP